MVNSPSPYEIILEEFRQTPRTHIGEKLKILGELNDVATTYEEAEEVNKLYCGLSACGVEV
jgi:hypothetical protein